VWRLAEREFAMKTMPTDKKSDMESVLMEIAVPIYALRNNLRGSVELYYVFHDVGLPLIYSPVPNHLVQREKHEVSLLMQLGASSLADLLSTIRPLPPAAVGYYSFAMAQFLDTLHGKHRLILTDAACKNYVLDARTGELLAIDFGLAAVDESRVKFNFGQGRTYFYMAPERHGCGNLDMLATQKDILPSGHHNLRKLCALLLDAPVIWTADVWTLGYNLHYLHFGEHPLVDVGKGEDVISVATKYISYLYPVGSRGVLRILLGPTIPISYCRQSARLPKAAPRK
jgi:serine/threonine protein kinase